ncbi:MAG: dihydropteroate synthase [Pseudomonadota bacterium]
MTLDVSKEPVLMGVVNVTPDSFSDGGQFLDAQKAIDHGLMLVEQGAHILDIGGESTRPGAEPVSPAEEQDRILPVIEGLKSSGALLSADTRHTETMRVAIEAGVGMINDVNALRAEGAVEAVANSDVLVCLMHMQNNPQTMQKKPNYDDVIEEISNFLQERMDVCKRAGIDRKRIVLDPGIGFGKSLKHNVDILKNINQFSDLGVSILLGTSRKSFIEKIDKGAKEDQRIGGSLASVLYAYSQGVRIFRVHDVFETRQALAVFQAISEAN